MRAHPRTFSIRPRTREALSGMVDQIGLRTRSTSGVSIAATGSEPSSGKAYLISDLSHSCRCLRLVHEVSLSLIKPFTQSANVMALASAAFSAARALAGDGVDALKAELAGISGLLPRLGEREHMHRADTHIAGAA